MRSLLMAGALTACASPPSPAPTSAPVADWDPEEHAWFDAGGQTSGLAEFAASVVDSDLIAFGELHGHGVGSRYQLELLEALNKHERPLALAMEFFESDQQVDLDAYLSGQIDEATFIERTKRNEAYADSHRPLVEFCKQAGIPIIAANAPRRLVTAYRKSGLSYPDYLDSLTVEQREWLPRESVPPDDEHKRRFLEAMQGMDHGDDLFKSMALWNDAMAESAADFREQNTDHRVLLIVGVFHVQKRLGTVTQFLRRRPGDTVGLLSMMSVEETKLDFTEEHRDEGDVILLVRPTP